ncbi:SNTG1-like protein [Mya arenaria]|uniref:SNTG1-like protein n=1 Tax=Mya arenaria TaxID=6604 RepID=A0ABY7FAR6_MYAAR|nr:SNTG1-like protein [Mya arenaria]
MRFNHRYTVVFKAKVGFATLCESRSLGEVVQLKLTAEVLVLLREEYVPREPPAEENGNESILEVIRTVELRREREGGLGLSVKGGQEHKLPALISRIVPNQAAAKTQQLFVGDAILKVNGENIEAYSHDQVIETLRSAGDVVTLSVKYFKPAAVFLNKSSNSVPRLEKSWVIYSSIPLLYANLTRYRSGTDKLRSNAFELVGVDGTTSGVLQFDDNHSLAEWMAAITNNINSLLTQMIEFMGWSQQRGSPGTNAQPWSPKFIALKGPDIHLFDMPPMQARDWERCDTVFHVYECMFKILQDSELVDDKQNCCSVQTTSKETIYLSLESRAELLQLERAWYRTNHGAIARLKTYLWTYKFSRLKGSSDDGKQRLKLHFSTDTPGQVDAKEVECSSLQLLLFCIHAFLSAKLASVDPSFLANY